MHLIALQLYCTTFTHHHKMTLTSTITISFLILLFLSHVASAGPATDYAAINTCIRGGASIDGDRNKRFSLNRLKPSINRTSQLDRRRDDLNTNSKRNTSVSENSKVIGSIKSTSKSPQKSKKFKMYMTCISIVFSWLSLSTLFYAKFYDWPYPQVSNLNIHTNNTKCV
jgi:hypothetical protein